MENLEAAKGAVMATVDTVSRSGPSKPTGIIKTNFAKKSTSKPAAAISCSSPISNHLNGVIKDKITLLSATQSESTDNVIELNEEEERILLDSSTEEDKEDHDIPETEINGTDNVSVTKTDDEAVLTSPLPQENGNVKGSNSQETSHPAPEPNLPEKETNSGKAITVPKFVLGDKVKHSMKGMLKAALSHINQSKHRSSKDQTSKSSEENSLDSVESTKQDSDSDISECTNGELATHAKSKGNLFENLSALTRKPERTNSIESSSKSPVFSEKDSNSPCVQVEPDDSNSSVNACTAPSSEKSNSCSENKDEANGERSCTDTFTGVSKDECVSNSVPMSDCSKADDNASVESVDCADDMNVSDTEQVTSTDKTNILDPSQLDTCEGSDKEEVKDELQDDSKVLASNVPNSPKNETITKDAVSEISANQDTLTASPKPVDMATDIEKEECVLGSNDSVSTNNGEPNDVVSVPLNTSTGTAECAAPKTEYVLTEKTEHDKSRKSESDSTVSNNNEQSESVVPMDTSENDTESNQVLQHNLVSKDHTDMLVDEAKSDDVCDKETVESDSVHDVCQEVMDTLSEDQLLDERNSSSEVQVHISKKLDLPTPENDITKEELDAEIPVQPESEQDCIKVTEEEASIEEKVPSSPVAVPNDSPLQEDASKSTHKDEDEDLILAENVGEVSGGSDTETSAGTSLKRPRPISPCGETKKSRLDTTILKLCSKIGIDPSSEPTIDEAESDSESTISDQSGVDADANKITKQEITALIKKKMDDYVERMHNSMLGQLQRKIVELTAQNDHWKEVVKTQQQQLIELSNLQTTRNERRSRTTKVPTRNVATQFAGDFKHKREEVQLAGQPTSQVVRTVAPTAQATTPANPILLTNKPGTALVLQQPPVTSLASSIQQVQYIASSDLKSVAQQVGQNGLARSQVVYTTQITNQPVKAGSAPRPPYPTNSTVRHMLETKRGAPDDSKRQSVQVQKSPVRVIDLTSDDASPKSSGAAKVAVQAPAGASPTIRQQLVTAVSPAGVPPPGAVIRAATSAPPPVNLAAAGLKPGTYIIQQTSPAPQPGTMLVYPSTAPPTGQLITAPATFVPGTSVVRTQLLPIGQPPVPVTRLPLATTMVTTVQQTRLATPVTSTSTAAAPTSKITTQPSQATTKATSKQESKSDDVVILKHPAPLPPIPSNTTVAPDNKQPPPKPGLKISRVAQGIVLSWNMALTDKHSAISEYQLYAYHEGSAPPTTTLWKKVGDVSALPLPMACTLTQFQEGNRYHFAVRALDKHKRVGPFSDINSIHLQKVEK